MSSQAIITVGSENALTVQSAGVGIGTTSPTHTLTVSGSAQITGQLYDSDGDAGTSGQVLSNTGTATDWITNSTDSITDADDDTQIQVEEGSDDDTIRFDAAGIEVATFTSTQTTLNTAVTASSTLAVSGNATVTADLYIGANTTASGTLTSKSTITLNASLVDADGDEGTAGQVLSSTGTSTNWIDISSDSITDADGDTQIQVEEGADDDTIRFDTAGSERLTITSTGEVLLGNPGIFAGPFTNSVVVGVASNTTNYNSRLRLTAGNNDSFSGAQGASIDLHGNNTLANTGKLDLVAGAAATATETAINFYTNTSSTTQQLSAVITGEGNLGIGTTTPAQTLTVSGTAQVTGQLYDSGGDAGIAGQVLSSTGTSTNWIDISSDSITDADGDTKSKWKKAVMMIRFVLMPQG